MSPAAIAINEINTVSNGNHNGAKVINAANMKAAPRLTSADVIRMEHEHGAHKWVYPFLVAARVFVASSNHPLRMTVDFHTIRVMEVLIRGGRRLMKGGGEDNIDHVLLFPYIYSHKLWLTLRYFGY